MRTMHVICTSTICIHFYNLNELNTNYSKSKMYFNLKIRFLKQNSAQ